jgi:pyruvate/2-oxoglutarate dehydrogenase complex dihydrolipoamide acyltransferase (E2) component
MPPFVIDVPMPSMGATVSELTVVSLAVAPGAVVAKGQKLAEFESDKSAFDFESPCAGTVLEFWGAKGAVLRSGRPFVRMRTSDETVRHLEARGAVLAAGAATPTAVAPAGGGRTLVWTPRATKLAQEAGLDPGTITDLEATGPGGRVSGDDVVRYLAARR